MIITTEPQRMVGKVCMVTGATSGIGQATALALAGLGARVIIVSRSPGKCAATAERIRQQTGNPDVDYLSADLSSQIEIRRLVENFHARYDHLEVLVNNAGEYFLRRGVSADGIEKTLALNHLSYFLLTNLLLDTLIASDPARIVIVSSESHRGIRIDFNDLQGERNYDGLQAYGHSKIANLLFTYELARHIEEEGYGSMVTVNALHPGFVATDIAGDNGWLVRLAMKLAHLVAKSPEDGARTSVYLAASSEVEGVTGKYFIDCKPVPSDPVTYDQDIARRLWEISAKMTGLDSFAE